jgi:hypothetical protein
MGFFYFKTKNKFLSYLAEKKFPLRTVYPYMLKELTYTYLPNTVFLVKVLS